jgi:hypothetical protein
MSRRTTSIGRILGSAQTTMKVVTIFMLVISQITISTSVGPHTNAMIVVKSLGLSAMGKCGTYTGIAGTDGTEIPDSYAGDVY